MIKYLDTYNKNGYTYEDYLDYCNDNELEPKDDESNDYYDWLSEQVDLDWEDFFDNIEYVDLCQRPVTVCGKLGLWWGSPTIEPTKFDDLKSAILACAEGSWDLEVTLDKGILSVVGYHHDGRNYFTIHREHGYFWPKYLY